MASVLNGSDNSSLDDVPVNTGFHVSSTLNGVDVGSTTADGVGKRSPKGCKIDRVEMRGITIDQLECLLTEVEVKCKKGEMKCKKKDTEELLPVYAVDKVTLHDIRENIIIPQTKGKQCSYIETIATSEQKTTWCVVFRLDQTFKDIVTVLKQHSKDRQLKSTDCYWMHVRRIELNL